MQDRMPCPKVHRFVGQSKPKVISRRLAIEWRGIGFDDRVDADLSAARRT